MDRKNIYIQKGDEYRARVRTIEEGDFSFESIERAYKCLEEISCELSDVRKNKESRAARQRYYEPREYTPEVGNNIILFSGERGQGKTSILLNFMNRIQSHRTEEKKPGYAVMNIIDPSRLAEGESLVRILTSAIYDSSDELLYTSRKLERENEENTGLATRMSGLFKDIFELTGELQGKRQEDYYDDLEMLSRLASSAKIRAKVEKLVGCYLELNHRKDGLLIVPIDDLDLCIQDAYSLCEEIRQHLAVSNVVVIMAANYKQLQYAVEQTYLKKYERLLAQEDRSVILEQCEMMTGRYLEKLFPGGHRVELPDIHAMSGMELSQITLCYDEIPEWKTRTGDEGETISEGIQVQLIKIIYDRTGIMLLEGADGMNVLLPQTLRELTHFAGFVAKEMKNNDSKDTLIDNVRKLRRFFMNYWCRNYLSLVQQRCVSRIDAAGGDIRIACNTVRELIGEEVAAANEYSLYDLMYMLYFSRLKYETQFCEAITFYYTLYLQEVFLRSGLDAENWHLIDKFFISSKTKLNDSKVRVKEENTGADNDKQKYYYPYRFKVDREVYQKIAGTQMWEMLLNRGWVYRNETTQEYEFDVRNVVRGGENSHSMSMTQMAKEGVTLAEQSETDQEVEERGSESIDTVWVMTLRNVEMLVRLQQTPGHFYESAEIPTWEGRMERTTWGKDLASVLEVLNDSILVYNRMNVSKGKVKPFIVEDVGLDLEKLFLCNQENLEMAVEDYQTVYGMWKTETNDVMKHHSGESTYAKSSLVSGTSQRTYIRFYDIVDSNSSILDSLGETEKSNVLAVIQKEKELRTALTKQNKEEGA